MNAFEDSNDGAKSEDMDKHEGKTDRDLLLEIANHVNYLVEARRDHENRIRKIEHDAWKQAGAVGVISVLISAFLAWLVSFFTNGHK